MCTFIDFGLALTIRFEIADGIQVDPPVVNPQPPAVTPDAPPAPVAPPTPVAPAPTPVIAPAAPAAPADPCAHHMCPMLIRVCPEGTVVGRAPWNKGPSHFRPPSPPPRPSVVQGGSAMLPDLQSRTCHLLDP
jgi:hypothetical protein